MDVNYLKITKKELFYAAVMLNIKQLVNIVYDFPADETVFEQELNEVKRSLSQKKLLMESARNGIKLDFSIIVCVSFCANPEGCTVVDESGYYATVYKVGKAYMLVEQMQCDELNVAWFADEEVLTKYIALKIEKGNGENGGS